MLKKDQWGPHFWIVIHYTALSYPTDTPSVDVRAKYKAFYEALGYVIPCEKCSKNYLNHIRELPIDPFLSSRDMLFKWTVNLHNIVNKEIGKPQWNEEIARAKLLNTSPPKDVVMPCVQDDSGVQKWLKAGCLLLSINVIVQVLFFILIRKR